MLEQQEVSVQPQPTPETPAVPTSKRKVLRMNEYEEELLKLQKEKIEEQRQQSRLMFSKQMELLEAEKKIKENDLVTSEIKRKKEELELILLQNKLNIIKAGDENLFRSCLQNVTLNI